MVRCDGQKSCTSRVDLGTIVELVWRLINGVVHVVGLQDDRAISFRRGQPIRSARDVDIDVFRM